MKLFIKDGVAYSAEPIGTIEPVYSSCPNKSFIGYYFNSPDGGNMNRGYVQIISAKDVKEI